MTDVETSKTAAAAHQPERVIIFDTTLRDGEQCPGAAMTFEQKVRIAKLLDEMGVDVIEAGYPNSSEEAFRAVQEISRIVKNATVCGLARALPEDIRRVAEAVRGAKKGRIHTFIATSPIHREKKLRVTKEELLQRIYGSVSLAKSLCRDVEWSAEDATRTEPEFLARCVEVAIAAGATTINLPDTVGWSSTGPDGMAEVRAMFAYVRKHAAGADGVVFSTHCHDDLGLATSNSLQALLGGARQVECTINGLGERAGNAGMEEIVMLLKVRHPEFSTGIDTTKFMQVSRLVASITGFEVAPNKAIIGRNAFAHESGIHQDGVLKERGTYEIMDPREVGQSGSKLVLGRHSGRKAVDDALRKLGYELGPNALADFFVRFKQVADRKKEVEADDLHALMGEASFAHERVQLENVDIHFDRTTRKVQVLMTVDGTAKRAISRRGNGPVDMAIHAVAKVAGIKDYRLLSYNVNAVTEGSDAQAETHVRLAVGGKEYSAKASDPDTVKSAAMAFMRAVNKIPRE